MNEIAVGASFEVAANGARLKSGCAFWAGLGEKTYGAALAAVVEVGQVVRTPRKA